MINKKGPFQIYIYIYISQGKKDHTGLLHQQKKSGERKVIVLSVMHENMKETKD